MVSENFGACRDIFYLGFLFFGGAAGFFLHWFRVGAKIRFRSRSVTLGLVLLSCAVAAFAVSWILAGGRLFPGRAFYITGIILAVLLVLAVRFPAAAGFPLVLAAGIVYVWIAWSFGQFPRLGGTQTDQNLRQLAVIKTGGNSELSFEINSGNGEITKMFSAGFVPGETVFDIAVTSFGYADFVPVIGGVRRGQITSVLDGGKNIYSDSRFDRGLLAAWLSGFRQNGFLGKRNFASVFTNNLILPEPETPQNPGGTFFGSAAFYPGNIVRIYFDGKNFSLR